jgi:hypothetical protein
MTTRTAYVRATSENASLTPAPSVTNSEPSEKLHLSRILFLSKCIFPPLSLLEKRGVRFYRVYLKANQVLMAHGGFTHYGINLVSGETHSFASNFVTESWFKEGGPEFIIHFFQWVQRLQTLSKTKYEKTTRLKALMLEHDISENQLKESFNVCPQAFACTMLQGMRQDLRHHLSDPTIAVKSYTMSREEVQSTISKLSEALYLLHQMRSFIHKIDARASVCVCKVAWYQQQQPQQLQQQQSHSSDDDRDTASMTHRRSSSHESDIGALSSSSRYPLRFGRNRKNFITPSDDEERKTSAVNINDDDDDEEKKVETTTSATRTTATITDQRGYSKISDLLLRLKPRNSNDDISTVEYNTLSDDKNWYDATAIALSTSRSSIREVIEEAVNAVPDIATA